MKQCRSCKKPLHDMRKVFCSIDCALNGPYIKESDAKERLTKLLNEGNYEAVVDEVNEMFGFEKGELETIYTKEMAEWCLDQIS